jgi:hypothetical protein
MVFLTSLFPPWKGGTSSVPARTGGLFSLLVQKKRGEKKRQPANHFAVCYAVAAELASSLRSGAQTVLADNPAEQPAH